MNNIKKTIRSIKNDDDDDMVVFLDEDEIGEMLTWPMAFWSADQSFRSVAAAKTRNQPESYEMNRLICHLPNEAFFSAMPGYIINFPVPKELKFHGINHEKEIETKELETFGCKLVTGFPENGEISPIPLPKIMGTICLFNTNTGKLQAVLEATTITSWRTAAASVVATQYMYFNRHSNTADQQQKRHLAIIGTGMVGSAHAIAMLTRFEFASLSLWDRRTEKIEEIRSELNDMRYLFANVNTDIKSAASVKECVENADVIVTATSSDTALIEFDMLKKGAHINAVGVDSHGHSSELDKEVYGNCKIYVDDICVAKNEQESEFVSKICGMVGDIIVGNVMMPSVDDITIFQSRGMAAEDVSIAKIIYEIYKNENQKGQGCCNIM